MINNLKTILTYILLLLLSDCGESRRLLSHLRRPKALADHQPQRCVPVTECPPLAVIADDELALEEYQRCDSDQVINGNNFYFQLLSLASKYALLSRTISIRLPLQNF